MFDIKVSATETIEIDLDITSSQNQFQKALENIGSYKDTDYQGDSVVIKGKSRYGLQGVPLVIQLDKLSDTKTRATIGGKSDDVGGVGAKKCIQRLITSFNTYSSNDTTAIETLESTPSFQRKTGFTPLRLLLLVGVFVVILIVVMQSSSGSVYGRYKVHSDNYILKDAIESQDAYIEVNKNGSIFYHAAMNGFPTIDNEGSFTLDDDVLHINWYSGRLPSTIRLTKSGSTYSMNVSGTTYQKE